MKINKNIREKRLEDFYKSQAAKMPFTEQNISDLTEAVLELAEIIGNGETENG